MANDVRIRNQATAAIIRGVTKKTVLLIAIGIAAFLGATFFYDAGPNWWRIPLSALFGGVLGLINFRWLAFAVERVYLRKGFPSGFSNVVGLIMSFLKLALIFIVLFVVIRWQLLHIFGMITGLSLCFLAIVWEGAAFARQNLINNG